MVLRQQTVLLVNGFVESFHAEVTERQADRQEEKVHRAELVQVGPQRVHYDRTSVPLHIFLP
jgi:hypothetical protein